MRLPNGYGSVYKLKGNRRNPWVARKTIGMKDIEEKKKSYPIYQYIGYFHTRKEALEALAAFNRDPFDAQTPEMTLQELFDAWSDAHSAKIKPSTLRAYTDAFRVSEKLSTRQIRSLRLSDFQAAAKESGKNRPTLHRWKVVLGLIYKYAVQNEILKPEKREMIKNIDITFAGNPNKIERTVFSQAEIDLLWSCGIPGASIVLMLLYSGLRISEFLAITKADVDLDRQSVQIRESKTAAGIREIPIADKTLPFWREMVCAEGEDFLYQMGGRQRIYNNFRPAVWVPVMEALKMTHSIHETRHTFVTRLTELGVDQRIVKQLVGHATPDITEGTYTHIGLEAKLEAVNKL